MVKNSGQPRLTDNIPRRCGQRHLDVAGHDGGRS